MFDMKAYQKKWREDNKERIQKGNLRYQIDNAEFIKLRSAAYRAANLGAIKEKNKAWRERNADRVKNHKRLINYNITPEIFHTLLHIQDYRCCICLVEFTDKLVPHVDHDHACCQGIKSCGMCIRGLLCARCNRILGAAGDSEEVFRNALIYLQVYKKGAEWKQLN